MSDFDDKSMDEMQEAKQALYASGVAPADVEAEVIGWTATEPITVGEWISVERSPSGLSTMVIEKKVERRWFNYRKARYTGEMPSTTYDLDTPILGWWISTGRYKNFQLRLGHHKWLNAEVGWSTQERGYVRLTVWLLDATIAIWSPRA